LTVARFFLIALAQTLGFALLLFVPAGTLDWWRAWVVLAVVLIGTFWATLGLWRTDPALLAERMKPPLQREQSQTDRIVLPATLIGFVGLLALCGLDVFHWHLLPQPPAWLAALGLGLFVVGWVAAYAAMRANTFAAPVVKLQPEREQHVIDTGPYGIVRHPMYAGGLMVFFGIPLWLDSTAATLFSLVPIALVAVRIANEEHFLRVSLPGYDAYAARVRYRLIPLVW
jgi:protein-S-isoprenylcysteine O-methyltransferase Ste14